MRARDEQRGTVAFTYPAHAVTKVTAVFERQFQRPPDVVATVQSTLAAAISDVYAATADLTTPGQVTFNVLRVDAAAASGATLRLSWRAWV